MKKAKAAPAETIAIGALRPDPPVLQVGAELLRAEIRFKNARLYDAIVAAAAPPLFKYSGVQEGKIKPWCDLHGLNHAAVYDLLNLKISPVMKRDVNGAEVILLRPICARVAALLGKSPEWLFPAELYARRWPRIAAYVEPGRFQSILEPAIRLALPAAQEDDLARKEMRAAIDEALLTLTPREASVLRARFGLSGEDEATLSDIGERLGVTQERVRQIEAKAMRKMRHPSRHLKILAAK